MRPSIYDSKYKSNHPCFKSICLKNFPYFLQNESWFKKESSNIYRPFTDYKNEMICWEKYIASNRTDKCIENELFSRYIWLTFRIMLFINNTTDNRNNEDEFQESIILLLRCIKLFDITTDCSFFSYYCESLKKYIKKIKINNRLFDCGSIKPTTYLIQHIMIINREDPNEKIENSSSAMTLNNTLNLQLLNTDTIEKLINTINSNLFAHTAQICYYNDSDSREEIYLEDTKDYDYEVRNNFYEDRINELYKFLKIKLYKNENKKLKRKDSLNVLFYLNGCILDEDNRWRIVSDKLTYSEVALHCDLSRQGIQIKRESIINRIKNTINKNEIEGILNGSVDIYDII